MVETRVILVAPQGLQNLGACARLCANFGVPALDLVRPPRSPIHQEALKFATGGSDSVLRQARTHSDLSAAVKDCDLAVAFCGKDIADAPPSISLEELVAQSRSRRLALVFGNEQSGLERRDVDLCDRVCRIPTPGLYSLNLSHALAIVLSKLHSGVPSPARAAPGLASRSEVEEMLDRGRELLIAIGLSRAGNPDRFLASFRRVFGRAELRPNEVRSLRSVFFKALLALGRGSRYQSANENDHA